MGASRVERSHGSSHLPRGETGNCCRHIMFCMGQSVLKRPHKQTVVESAYLTGLTLLLMLTLQVSDVGTTLTDTTYRWLGPVAYRSSDAQHLFLVPVDQDALKQDEIFWRKLVAELARHKPLHVVLGVFPPLAGEQFYRDLARLPSVSFALSPVLLPDGSVAPAVSSGTDTTFPHGWLLPVLWLGDGTLGYQRSIDSDEQHTLAIELIAARAVGRDITVIPDYFRTLPSPDGDALPQINAAYIAEFGVVEDLVRDKWVIIGHASLSPQPFASRKDNRLLRGSLNLHGEILNALLTQRLITRVDGTGKAIVLIFAFLLAAGLFSSRLAKRQRWLLGGWMLITALLALILYRWLFVQLPVSEILLLPACVLAFNALRKHRKEKAVFLKVARLTESSMHRHRDLSGFFYGEGHWEKILLLIKQTLQLDRTIILDRAPGKDHLQVVASHNCDISQLFEQRRDFNRPPFDIALQHGRPIQPERPFFQIDEQREVQYLCPLTHSGQVLGFWGLTLTRESMLSTPHFEDILRQYTAQISELLYNRNLIGKQPLDLVESQSGQQIQNLNRETILQRVVALEGQLRDYNALINCTNSGLFLYDLFGNLVLSNAAAQAYARRHNVAIFDGNALDLVIALTGSTQRKGQDILLDTIINQATTALPVTSADGVSTHIVHIRAVPSLHEPEMNSAPLPFDAQGILFELIDNSRIARINREQDNLLLNLGSKVIDLIQSAYLTAGMVKRTLQTNKLSALDVEDMEEILKDMAKTIAAINKQVNASEDIVRSGYFYADLKQALDDSIERHQPAILGRLLELDTNIPSYSQLAKANVRELDRVLDRIWELLLETCEEGSQLQINLEEFDEGGKTFIYCVFNNVGYGLTEEIISSYGKSELAQLTPQLSSLRLAANEVAQWSGALTLRSSFGNSLSINLMLESFSPHA